MLILSKVDFDDSSKWTMGSGLVRKKWQARHLQPLNLLSLRSISKERIDLEAILSSIIHRRQKWEISSWTLRQRFLGWNLFPSTESGANWPPIWPCKKWFGVKEVVSDGLAVWKVIGLELRKDSAPMKAVISSSSSISPSRRTAWMAFLAALIIIMCSSEMRC